MRTPVGRVGIYCVKLIVAWSKNPIVEELKKFNRNVTPVKTDRIWNSKRYVHIWKRRLTVADFVQQWQGNVFRALHYNILIRALKTKLHLPRDVTHYRRERDLHQRYRLEYLGEQRLREFKRQYATDASNRNITKCRLAQTVWDKIPFNETVFGFPITADLHNPFKDAKWISFPDSNNVSYDIKMSH